MRMPWKMKWPQRSAAFAIGGAIAGATIATHGLLLLPVAIGLVWMGTQRKRPGVNYSAKAAALLVAPTVQSCSAPARPRGLAGWRVWKNGVMLGKASRATPAAARSREPEFRPRDPLAPR